MDQHGWNQGNIIAATINEAKLWFGQSNWRKAKRGQDAVNWFFTDCFHPAQNAFVDLSRVLAWKAISAAPHTAATPADKAQDQPPAPRQP